jgi:hypothetical protein
MRIVNIIVILLGLVLLTTCTLACSVNNNKQSITELKILKHTMNVHKFGGDRPQGKVTVSGQVQNVSDHLLTAARIHASFYDKKGKLIYESFASKESLHAGEVWYFTIEGIGADIWKITKYDLSTSTER